MNHEEHIMKAVKLNLKHKMIRSNLCDYSDAYVHVKVDIEIPNTRTATAPNNKNNKVTFENYAPFINSISRINNTQVDDAHDIDVVMPMENLIEYSDTYSKTSGILQQFYRDEPALDDNEVIIDFPADYISLKVSLKLLLY